MRKKSPITRRIYRVLLLYRYRSCLLLSSYCPNTRWFLDWHLACPSCIPLFKSSAFCKIVSSKFLMRAFERPKDASYDLTKKRNDSEVYID